MYKIVNIYTCFTNIKYGLHKNYTVEELNPQSG